MPTFEIPLVPRPQLFDVTLAGLNYEFRIVYADAPEGGWILDISSPGEHGNHIIAGIPLVVGVDLLSPYAYLLIGGALYVHNDAEPASVPTFDNLGVRTKLYFVTPG